MFKSELEEEWMEGFIGLIKRQNPLKLSKMSWNKKINKLVNKSSVPSVYMGSV